MTSTVEPLSIFVDEPQVILTPHRAAANAPPAHEPAPWPWWQRVVFRYALCHVLLFSLPGPLLGLVWTIDSGLQYLAGTLDWPLVHDAWSWPRQAAGFVASQLAAGWQALTTWMGDAGLAPYEVIHQSTGSGDTGHGFARLLAIVVVSAGVAAIWSALQWRPVGYPRLGRWLHLYTRWYVALVVLGYGLAKFYGGQFGELGPSRLTQEIGETLPMTMVGTFMQASKPYELFGGAGEVVGALLLLHHRTALLGALVTIAVFTNVCALNWLYGVPVKLASTHYLLFAIGLTAPWAGRLWALLVANRPSRPVDMRVVQRPRLVWALALFGCAWILCHVVNQHFTRTRSIAANEQRRPKPELYGVWRVERMLVDGAELPIENATRWRDVAIDRGPSLRVRELTGRAHSFDLTEQLADEKLVLKPRAGGDPLTFTSTRGTKQVPERNPLPLRNTDRNKPVEVERRTLVLRGTWNGKPLEVSLVERGFPIQTPFRLRQELPDFW